MLIIRVVRHADAKELIADGHPAARPRLAGALLDHYAKDQVHVRSAGSTPAEESNPEVITAMAELGLDLSQEFPKPMTEDWEFDDPADADLEGVRRIRDELARTDFGFGYRFAPERRS